MDRCGLFSKWYNLGKTFEAKSQAFFESLAFFLCQNSVKTLCAVSLFFAVCSVGFLNFREETVGVNLYVPQDSQAKTDQKFVEKYFGKDSRGGIALFSAGNVVTLSMFEQLWDFHEDIKLVSANDDVWSDLCEVKDYSGACFVNGPTEFWSNNRTLYNEVVSSVDDIIKAISAQTFPSGIPVSRETLFGKAIYDDGGRIVSAEGMMQYYTISGFDESTAATWEESYLKTCASRSISGGGFYYFADRSFDDEVSRSVDGDVHLFAITYVIMICFTCVMMTLERKTRVGLGISGICITFLAMLAAYGVCSGFGVPYTNLHSILPFIVLGIGVDDMFVITFTFDQQSTKLPKDVRLANALKTCGLSIAYTTATDVVAFILGTLSILPAISSFCFYASITLLFNFCFQLTAYSVLLTWDADAGDNTESNSEYSYSKASTDYPTSLESATRVSMSKSQQMVSMSASHDCSNLEQMTIDRVSTPVYKEPVYEEEGLSDLNEDPKGKLNQLQRFLGNVYHPIISNQYARLAIVFVFAAVLGAAMWSCSTVTQGFDLTIFLPDESYAKEYIEESKRLDLFQVEKTIPVHIYFKDLAYNDQSVQEIILELQDDFIKTSHIKGPVNSWMSEFTSWVGSDASPYKSQVNLDGFLTDQDAFYAAVESFVTSPTYARFASDIVFNYDTDGKVYNIDTSRVSAFHHDLSDPMSQVHGMQNARKVCANAALSPTPFPFSVQYVFYETEAVIVSVMYENLLMAVLGVAVVSAIILIYPRAVVFACFLLCAVDTNIIGAMGLAGLTINTITVMLLVMAVGLVVDYIAHMIHYYLRQPQHLSPDERVRQSLIEIGPSILMGCSSTFFGILPLGFANSQMFRMFFQMFLFIIVFGAAYGLILVPTVLPWIPFGDTDRKDMNVDKMTPVDKTKASWFISTFIHPILYLMIGVSTYIFFTLYCGCLFLICGKWDGFDASKVKDKNIDTKVREVKVVHHTDMALTKAEVTKHIAKSEPIIVRGLSVDFFSIFRTKFAIDRSKQEDDNILILQYTLPMLGKLGSAICSMTNRLFVMYMASFSGSYKSGVAHMDAIPSYNFYYVQKGEKRVYIVPHEYTDHVDMVCGIDNVYVKEDSHTEDKMEWLQSLPEYYKFKLEEGDVLIFNNSKCIHKFTNLTGAEEIFTMRLFYMDSSPLVYRQGCFNYGLSFKLIASILINHYQCRDPSDIANYSQSKSAFVPKNSKVFPTN